MKKLSTLFLTAACLLATHLRAQTTWSADIAPIVYNHCATCHHSGAIAPFALMTYAEASAEAYAMAGDVQSHIMPPWPPDPNYNHMAHERLLTQTDIDKITDWAANGAPEGNPAVAPPPPTFSTIGNLPGTPDLVVKIPTYTSTAATGDVYRCFVLDNNQSIDKYITAFEAVPGTPAMVHHVLVYADTTGTSTQLDAQDPGPGYTSFGGIGTDNAIMLGGWVPGSSPISYPANFGVKLPHNAKIVLQIHYPQGTDGMVDSTEVHFFFSASPTLRDVYIVPALNHYTNITEPLVIPANTTKTFTEQQVNPLDITLLGVAPHMHLIGKSIKTFGVAPTGDTQQYISVPDWEFHWQGFYLLRQMMHIVPGTTLYSSAYYDNTTNNPDNPSNPPQTVSAGESTTDEMMLTYFVVAQYQTGDENIIIDSSYLTPTGIAGLAPYYKDAELFTPYPIPATNQLIAKWYLSGPTATTIELLSYDGKTAATVFNGTAPEGYHTQVIPLTGIASGNYVLRMRANGKTATQKVVVTD